MCVCVRRQPAGVCLFPTGSEFSAVADVIIRGVASSCVQVSIHAIRAAAFLFRYHTQINSETGSEIQCMSFDYGVGGRVCVQASSSVQSGSVVRCQENCGGSVV